MYAMFSKSIPGHPAIYLHSEMTEASQIYHRMGNYMSHVLNPAAVASQR